MSLINKSGFSDYASRFQTQKPRSFRGFSFS
jgi:hypothetical protein